MCSVPHEFVTVEMRDLKVALLERSRADRVSVSRLVRDFVAAGLGRETADASPGRDPGLDRTRTVKLSIRISAGEAMRLSEGARRAGLSRPAYLAQLIDRPPQIVTSEMRSRQLALVATANAELSTLARNLRHLATLLSRGSWLAAEAYRGMLDSLTVDVRRHLSMSAALLDEARPRRASAAARPRRPSRTKAVHE